MSKSTPWTVKRNDSTSGINKRKTQNMERMERLQRARRRIAADAEQQSNIGKKNAKHMVKPVTCARSRIISHLFVALETNQQAERQYPEDTKA